MRTLLIGTVVAALFATGCDWSFETLDGQVNGPHGQNSGSVGQHNTAILYNGRPHVFYYDAGNQVLRHAYWNGQFWAFETLDGHQTGPHGQTYADVGEHAAAILHNGRPHIFYYDFTNGNLRHAYYNGQYWAFETLDGYVGPHGAVGDDVGEFASVVIYSFTPHVFYFDATVADLRHAYWNGRFWAFETLDGHQTGPKGQLSSPLGTDVDAINHNGRPQVFYYDGGTNMNLRRAAYNGYFWQFENLDGHQNGPHGRIVADLGSDNAALVYNGQPHIFSYDTTGTDFRHGWFS